MKERENFFLVEYIYIYTPILKVRGVDKLIKTCFYG